MPKRAEYWDALPEKAVECRLCPRRCRIEPEQRGWCGVRDNRDGVLYAETWGRPAAVGVDPIEKKPLHCFLPGTMVFSIGCAGCNLGCVFCQNSELSRGVVENFPGPEVPPEMLVELARRRGCPSIAFTYNEPTVEFEYARDTFRLAREAGLKTVLVTNGFISPEPRAELYELADAANIDVKGFDDFYESMCAGRLAPVLESCEFFHSRLHRHLEITNLLIPGRNDSSEAVEKLLDWAEAKLGLEVPLHFSAYFPAGGYDRSPATPRETVLRACGQARHRGFSRVFAGNIR